MTARWALAAMIVHGLGALPAQALTVVYSNDVLAEIEPCGCRENPYGGVVRKAGLLGTLGKEPLIQVDAGDLLFKTDTIPAALKKQSGEQARYVLQAHEALGHDVVVPGEKDFALGLGFFSDLISGSRIKFIAANLKRKNGRAFLEPSVILKRTSAEGKSIRVAVLGLVSKSLAWPSGLVASDPVAVARVAVPELRKNADFVIALTHQGSDEDQALARAVPGIDFVIGGHSQSFLQEPIRIRRDDGKETWVLQSSFRNQYVGLLPLLNPSAHRLVGLDPGYESPERVTPLRKRLEALVGKFKKSVADANSAPIGLSAVGLERQAQAKKFQTFPRCAECHWKQFDFWRTTHHGNALASLIKRKQLRNKECLNCHSVGWDDPEGYKEVDQIASLRSPDGKSDSIWPIEEAAAWLTAAHEASSLKDTARLTKLDPEPMTIRRSVSRISTSFAPVQCENCHGPGLNHPFTSGYTKTISSSTCLKCHTPYMAPKWYDPNGKPNESVIAGKIKSISCPAGDETE